MKVYKQLTVRSTTGNSTDTIVLAANASDHVFEVTVDLVTICGFTTKNATGSDKAGIYLGGNASHCNISGNNATKNNIGIWLYGSSSNMLAGNTASNNSLGIYLYSSSNNTIYNNHFNNTNNAWDDGNNVWNITKTAGKNVIGGSCIGGNYWSGYTGEDSDGDGLGDTQIPYNSSSGIQNGGDWLPLVMPAPYFSSP